VEAKDEKAKDFEALIQALEVTNKIQNQ